MRAGFESNVSSFPVVPKGSICPAERFSDDVGHGRNSIV